MTDHPDPSNRWLTLPNAVTVVRMLGSPLLVILAVAGQVVALLCLALCLVFTEWLDGFLARRLHMTSAIGARLDAIADAVFYSSLLAAVLLLRPAVVRGESIWIVMAVASYLLSWLASWLKFHCLPSYHTWAAKAAWIVVAMGIISLLSDFSPWPFRIAMVGVTLANLEAIGITLTLPRCEVDVPSLWHARGNRSH